MPPRHTYWTIILEGKPTAFRAHTQEELLPTLKQLQARHPDAVLVWFARGRVWKSDVEAREALVKRRPPADRRGPAWRPGGSHEDPRARFKIPRDEKRRRFRERLFRDNVPDDREAPVEKRPEEPASPPEAPRQKPDQRPWLKDRRPPHEGGRPGRPRFDRKPGWKPSGPPGLPGAGDRGGKPSRPTGPSGGGGDRGWKPGRPAGQGSGDRGWKPNRPAGQGSGGGDRGRKPGRPPGKPGGDTGGGWKPNRPPGRPMGQGGGRRGGRPPGGAGRRGGGGGSSR